jgi:hypothetical protein
MTTYLIYSEKQQQISEGSFLVRVFDKVLNSSEHFWIITVGTVHARHQLDLITALCELATFQSMSRASQCTCIFCCMHLAAVRQHRGPACGEKLANVVIIVFRFARKLKRPV